MSMTVSGFIYRWQNPEKNGMCLLIEMRKSTQKWNLVSPFRNENLPRSPLWSSWIPLHHIPVPKDWIALLINLILGAFGQERWGLEVGELGIHFLNNYRNLGMLSGGQIILPRKWFWIYHSSILTIFSDSFHNNNNNNNNNDNSKNRW